METMNLEMAESEKEHLVYLKGRVDDVLAGMPKKVVGWPMKRAVIQLQRAAWATKGIRYEDAAEVYAAIQVIQTGLGRVL